MPPTFVHSSRPSGYAVNGRDKNPCLGGVDILVEEAGNWDHQHNLEIIYVCVKGREYLKYFRLGRPHHLSHNYSVCCHNTEAATEKIHKRMVMTVYQ